MKMMTKSTGLIAAIILICSLASAPVLAANAVGGGATEGTNPQQNEDSLPWTQYMYEKDTGFYQDLRKYVMQYTQPMSQGNGSSGSGSGSGGGQGGGSGSGGSAGSGGSGSGYSGPRELVTPATAPVMLPPPIWPQPGVPTAWIAPDERTRLFCQLDNVIMTPVDQALPTTDAEEYIFGMRNVIQLVEQEFAPENWLHVAEAMTQMTMTNAANSVDGVAVNQTQNAIDVVRWSIVNFTADPSSPFQKLRSQLFLPMAVLLLLVGAVAAQARAIIAQGSPILGEISPFEGLTRSLVAVFLIPGSFLVINYGIDVSNSITFTIADEYTRLFSSDMYQDAQDAEVKASAVNPINRDDNYIPPADQAKQPPPNTGGSPWTVFENAMATRVYDEESGQDKTDYPDEESPASMSANRLAMGLANSGLGMTWNVLCAFQMAYLYYLWCMGPIAAALWVFPMERLRSAFPSWVEGVVTLCFWSLFWNTVVLLMACFRGVGETGTVIMTALNGMAVLCAQFAFDFSSLISQGAAGQLYGAVSQAMRGASGGQAGGGGAKNAASGGRTGMSAPLTEAATPYMGGSGSVDPATGQPIAGTGGGAGGSTFNQTSGSPAAPGRFADMGVSPPASTGSPGSGNGAPIVSTLFNGPPASTGGLPGQSPASTNPMLNGLPGAAALGMSALLGASRDGSDRVTANMAGLGAPANNKDLPGWLNNLAAVGAFDPNHEKNPHAGNLLLDYLRTHPEDPSASGFANWLAQSDMARNTAVQDFLHNQHDPQSQAALGQFLAENPNMSLNDPRLNEFLHNHSGGFNINDLRQDPNLGNPMGLPPTAGLDDPTKHLTYDANGNLVLPPGTNPNDANGNLALPPGTNPNDANGNLAALPPGTHPNDPGTLNQNINQNLMGGTGLHPGVNPSDPNAALNGNPALPPGANAGGPIMAPPGVSDPSASNPSAGNPMPSVANGMKIPDFVDAQGHHYQIGPDGRPHLVDPANQNGQTDPSKHADPSANPQLRGLGQDMNQGLKADENNGPVTARNPNTGEVVATFDPNNNHWQGAHGESFTYQNGRFDMTNTADGSPAAPGLMTMDSLGNLMVAGTPLESVGGAGSPAMYAAHLGGQTGGQMLETADGGHSWYPTDPSGTTWYGHAYEYNTAAGGFSPMGSNGNIVMGNDGSLHMNGSGLPVTQTDQGFAVTDPKTGMQYASPDGSSWQQTASAVGAPAYHWDSAAGFTSGSVQYGDQAPVVPSASQPVASADLRPPDAAVTAPAFSPMQPSYDMESRALSAFVPEAHHAAPFVHHDVTGAGSTSPVWGDRYIGPESTYTTAAIPGTELTAKYDASGQWVVDQAYGGAVTYNQSGDQGLELKGTNVPVNYDAPTGTFYTYAANSDNPVVLQHDGSWAMDSPSGPVPVQFDPRANDFVAENAGMVSPTAHYVEPQLPTEIHPPVQPDPYTLTGTHVEGGQPWNQPEALAFEPHSDQIPQNQPVGMFFDSKHDRPESQASGGTSPTILPFVIPAAGGGATAAGPRAGTGRLGDALAKMQPKAASPQRPVQPPQVAARPNTNVTANQAAAKAEDLHTQMLRANQRGGRQLTKEEQRKLLLESGFKLDTEGNVIDDQGNVIG